MSAFNVNVSDLCLGMMLTPYTVEFDPGCEAMIYSMDGDPLQG